MKNKLPELKAKPIKGFPEEEWHKYNTIYLSRLENLKLGKNKVQSKETKEKRASSHRGKKRSKEFREHMSKIRTGMKIGPVTSKYVPVIATNKKTGEQIKFDGQVLAAKELNLTVGNISNTLKGLQKTTGGWYFKYV